MEDYISLGSKPVTIQNITYDFYSSNAVRKLLNFNNY